MKKIGFLTLLMVGFTLLGCSGVERSIEKTQVAMAGNKPPASFKVANLQTMKEYVFNMKYFTIAMPTAEQKDFSFPRGWIGWTHYGKNVVLALDNDKGYGMYHIYASTSGKIREFGEIERALENGNIKYMRKRIKIDHSDKLYIQRLGKEKYICTVMEYRKKNYKNTQYAGYTCYKFNPTKDKVKKVHIRLTYHKPENPSIAKQYTYADLKRRAKRTLDSLYIKDGW